MDGEITRPCCCELFLLGYVKSAVLVQPLPATLEKLKNSITDRSSLLGNSRYVAESLGRTVLQSMFDEQLEECTLSVFIATLFRIKSN